MRRSTLIGLGAGAAAMALVAGISVVWPGLDAQETPKVDTSVWALQTGDGKRYARVNTTIGELDTVRSINDPSEVAQTPDGAYLFSGSYSKVTAIDPTLPSDLDERLLEDSPSTPGGTTDVATAGDYVAYRTDSGTVFAGRLSDEGTTQLDPFPSDDEDAPDYTADAIAVDSRGMLFAFSRSDGAVLRYDIGSSEVRARDEIDVDEISAPSISAAGDSWVVVDGDDGDVWVADAASPVPSLATGASVISRPDPDGDSVYLADDSILVRVPVDGSALTTAAGREGVLLGTPAQPVVYDGELFAAWLPQGEGDGALWRESAPDALAELDYGGKALGEERRPVFVASDDAIIVNDTRSGWVWTVPDGALVESSQDWSLDDRTDPEAVPSEEEIEVQIDPKPPIAEPDTFGVRAGSLASLPVLLNDHDPNEDVLSIDPTSVSGLDPGFGAVSITDNGQRLAVRVTPEATGTATFSYAVTDGTSRDGLLSEPTTVTLTVSSAAGAAPQWCGVDGCLVEWPTPEVARGGTVTVPVLPGWVDPDGDPLLLLSVENPSGIGSVAATPSGDVVYQHSDDGSGTDTSIELTVTVSDTTGKTATKPLVVAVSDSPNVLAQSFAVVDSIGSGITVDVAPHVTGTAGALSLESVRVLDDADATATVVGGTTSFDFSANDPGTYLVGFTVTDGTSPDNAVARITLLDADAPAQLATSPVIAFVRPQEDATLDIFAAVSNPTGRVLLLSDVVARADDEASLSVDAVGQNHLRVSGSTASGASGRLGTVTYTVSDGTSDEGAQVQGEATVYLLPEARELAPIAVDDTVVVRAGSQIDIPVLENDISPAGGRPTLDPSRVRSTTDDALAFASGDVVRYLAPTEPGEYGIEYTVYTTGSPSLTDTATVKLQVLPDDANRRPLPETLEGRVLSGQSTSVEFDGFGMDPDGDVVTLDRIVEQPDKGEGVATISADGESIIYTSVAGFRGQVTFRYRVVDAFGETGEGTVRVGVLDSESNPSPITFTDYVQVQVGETNTIRVSPLANDIDPTMGTLAVTDVRPDVPEILSDGTDNPEFARLSEQIVSSTESTVVIAAGTDPGTMSYLYDVESDSGNTGRGLIVVKVVRESVPDYPIVADTVLSAESRDDFPTGVDVLADKVTWSGGEISDLELSLWGDQSGVTVDRWRLSGDLPATTRVIPFAVTGEGTSGEVTTYAFLRVPGDDDLSLALKAGTPPVEVTELESATFDMVDLVSKPRGLDIEVGGDVRASGARTEASCTVTGTSVTYDSGARAPWVDACEVPVRLVGQDEWTYLSVPITVIALDPQPELRPASMTVGPGETATYSLRNMTTWQLREDWDGIEYAVEYGGSAFEVALNGNEVTVTGADAAVPGSEEAALVSVTSHDSVTPVRLILRVGAAPSTLPKGGSTTQQCSQASGSSCSISVIGASGEVNPLPGTPLEVVGVQPSGACAGVSFETASASTVTASWSGDAPGATCSASFSVRDAQGRTTNGERNGRILLDLQGFPKAPASISQTAYADGTVTLRVAPGEASQAYPALTGFAVRTDGTVVAECSADGVCPPIKAPNGEKRAYQAVAVNAVGQSKAGVRTVGWAYDAPATPTGIKVAPVVTDGEGGLVRIGIEQVDSADTGELEISSPTGATIRVPVDANKAGVEVPSYQLGSNTLTPITITPLARFDTPQGIGGEASGQPAIVQGNGIGAPRSIVLSLSSAAEGDGTSRISVRASANPNGDRSSLRWGFVIARDGRELGACSVAGDDPSGSFVVEDGYVYRVMACAETWYDGQRFGYSTSNGRDSVRAVQRGSAPNGYTFQVGATPRVEGNQAFWTIQSIAVGSQPPRNNDVVYYQERQQVDPLQLTTMGVDPNLTVRFCHSFWGSCSDPGFVTAAAGGAPYQLQASWSLNPCVANKPLTGSGSVVNGDGTVSVDGAAAGVRFFDENGAQLAPATAGVVPPGAVLVDSVPVTIAIGKWGLLPPSDPVLLSAQCDPGPDPEPTEPAPTTP